MQAWVRWIDTLIKSIHLSKIEKYDVTSYGDVSIGLANKQIEMLSLEESIGLIHRNQSTWPKMRKVMSHGVIIPYKVKIIQNNNWRVPKSIRLIQNDLSF